MSARWPEKTVLGPPASTLGCGHAISPGQRGPRTHRYSAVPAPCASFPRPVTTRTHIIIVNYRTPDLAIQAVASVEPQRAELAGGRVILLDNASGDGSPQRLAHAVQERGWSDWVDVLPQPRNGGFSYGNNRGFDRVRELGDFGRAHLLLLNPDAQLEPGVLASALHHLQSHPRVGIVGVPSRSGAGQEACCSAHQWPSPLSELLSQAKLGVLSRLLPRHEISPPMREDSFFCDWVSGAFFLIRAEVAAQLGDMDEGYFLYFEEVDYCRRAAQHGWQTLLAAGPGILHWEGSSTGIADVAGVRPAYWYDSRRRFLIRHYGYTGLLLSDALSLFGRALYLPRKWLRLGAAGGGDAQPRHYHRRMLASDLKALLGR